MVPKLLKILHFDKLSLRLLTPLHNLRVVIYVHEKKLSSDRWQQTTALVIKGVCRYRYEVRGKK
jgi:hypothetical protein